MANIAFSCDKVLGENLRVERRSKTRTALIIVVSRFRVALRRAAL